MAEKLERKVMEIYGENAATRDIIAYGSDIAGNIVETKDPDVIQTEAYKTGVRSAVVGNNSTTLQNRQALDFLFSRQLKYLYQQGVPEWGADETYYQFSVVKGSDGNLYGSITDNNVGNNPVEDTLHTNWRNFPTYQELDAKVNKSGDTMTNKLTVSQPNIDSILGPAPTTIQYGTAVQFDDKAHNMAGNIGTVYDNYGAVKTRILVRRVINGTSKYGSINIGLDASGNAIATSPHPKSSANGDEIATAQWVRNLLNGQSGSGFDAVVETFSDANGNWYRKYKSGWLEQGGTVPAQGIATTVTITLLKAMKNTNYTVLSNPISVNTSTTSNNYVNVFNITTTSFNLQVWNFAEKRWCVFGQGAN